MMGFNEWNARRDQIAGIRAQYTPEEWEMPDEPAHPAGLRSGEVLDRWIDELPVFDRLLYWGVWAVVIGGGVTSLGLLLLGWMP